MFRTGNTIEIKRVERMIKILLIYKVFQNISFTTNYTCNLAISCESRNRYRRNHSLDLRGFPERTGVHIFFCILRVLTFAHSF